MGQAKDGDTAAAVLVGKVAAPGDVVMVLPEDGRVSIGSGGLRPQGGSIVATKYIPQEGDCVVGVVVDRMSEHFSVDIGGPFKAVLPMLSFENATKRNRPAIYEGDVVAARVVTSNPDMDPVLSCVDPAGRAQGYGHLKGGLVFDCSCSWARALLGSPPPAVLAALGAEAAFEMSIGLNGRIWVDAPSAGLAVSVARVLQGAEEQLRPGDDAAAYVRQGLAGGSRGKDEG